MRRLVPVFVFFVLAALVHAADGKTAAFVLQSSAFVPNGGIPARYTCDGDDISPPLAWSGVPKGTQSFALVVDDPDAPDPAAPKKTWVHWVIYNIPVAATGLPEGANPLPAGTSEGLNNWEAPGWRGPCPPVGRHRYFFKLYALNAVFAPTKPLSKADLENAMKGYVLAQATVIGTYEHPKR